MKFMMRLNHISFMLLKLMARKLKLLCSLYFFLMILAFLGLLYTPRFKSVLPERAVIIETPKSNTVSSVNGHVEYIIHAEPFLSNSTLNKILKDSKSRNLVLEHRVSVP